MVSIQLLSGAATDAMSTSRYGYFLVLTLAVFLADWETKKWAYENLARQPPMEITPFLQLVYVKNTEIFFGLLNNKSDGVRSVTILLLIFLLVMVMRATRLLEVFAWALLMGGVVGNFVDRMRRDVIIDIIDLHVGDWHWPAFNLADLAVIAGLLLLVYAYFNHPEEEEVADTFSETES